MLFHQSRQAGGARAVLLLGIAAAILALSGSTADAARAVFQVNFFVGDRSRLVVDTADLDELGFCPLDKPADSFTLTAAGLNNQTAATVATSTDEKDWLNIRLPDVCTMSTPICQLCIEHEHVGILLPGALTGRRRPSSTNSTAADSSSRSSSGFSVTRAFQCLALYGEEACNFASSAHTVVSDSFRVQTHVNPSQHELGMTEMGGANVMVPRICSCSHCPSRATARPLSPNFHLVRAHLSSDFLYVDFFFSSPPESLVLRVRHNNGPFPAAPFFDPTLQRLIDAGGASLQFRGPGNTVLRLRLGARSRLNPRHTVIGFRRDTVSARNFRLVFANERVVLSGPGEQLLTPQLRLLAAELPSPVPVCAYLQLDLLSASSGSLAQPWASVDWVMSPAPEAPLELTAGGQGLRVVARRMLAPGLVYSVNVTLTNVLGYQGSGMFELRASAVDRCVACSEAEQACARCQVGWSGVSCLQPDPAGHTPVCPDAAGPASPCVRNAECHPGNYTMPGSTYSCVCAAGWSGADCSIDIDECASSPCGEGLGRRVCVEGTAPGTYYCECDTDTPSDECFIGTPVVPTRRGVSVLVRVRLDGLGTSSGYFHEAQFKAAVARALLLSGVGPVTVSLAQVLHRRQSDTATGSEHSVEVTFSVEYADGTKGAEVMTRIEDAVVTSLTLQSRLRKHGFPATTTVTLLGARPRYNPLDAVDCELGGPGNWSQCSVACGGGMQTASRLVLARPSFGGQACREPVIEVRQCNSHACAAASSKSTLFILAAVLPTCLLALALLVYCMGARRGLCRRQKLPDNRDSLKAEEEEKGEPALPADISESGRDDDDDELEAEIIAAKTEPEAKSPAPEPVELKEQPARRTLPPLPPLEDTLELPEPTSGGGGGGEAAWAARLFAGPSSVRVVQEADLESETESE